MPERDPARRAVITGLGAIMPIGNDFPTYWSNLVAGVTGTRLDPGLRRVGVRGPHRGRGPRLRPDHRHGPQDGPPHEPLHPSRDRGRQGSRRATPGIDFAAMYDGAAGSRRRRRQHRRRRHRGDHRRAPTSTTRKGPRFVSAVRRAGAVGLDGRLHALDGVRPDRPGHHPGRRLRDLGHRLPRRPPAHPTRRVRRRPRRRLRGADRADGRRGALEHDRALEAQRLPGDRVAAVRPDARRVRARRGRRRRRRRVARPRARARRDARSPRSSAAP